MARIPVAADRRRALIDGVGLWRLWLLPGLVLALLFTLSLWYWLR